MISGQSANINESIFLYGPPGSGKSSVGPVLAASLSLPFIDLDQYIEGRYLKTIPGIFTEEGEAGFRDKESQAFIECVQRGGAVIALGGGALLDPELRKLAEEKGKVICLDADAGQLFTRLENSTVKRPLITDPTRDRATLLFNLLDKRKPHYASFQNSISTTQLTIDEVALQAQIIAGMFHIRGMSSEYDLRVSSGSLQHIGEKITQRSLQNPVAVVCDQDVARWYLEPVLESLRLEGFRAETIKIPSGEIHKSLDTIINIWNFFLETGIDRGGTIIALGGGVVNDLAGFAAATYLRGVKWVAIPTTLLSMVDASIGGKTGADLPRGKNLIGAFHPPALVLADPCVLKTLPKPEITSGLAEVIKHGIIADPELFRICRMGIDTIQGNLEDVVKRAMAVKVHVIQEDPFEKGRRAALNLGHTLGHAIEKVTHYQVRHGEAVAIGMVAAAKMSEYLEIGEKGLSEDISETLSANYLPTVIPVSIPKKELWDAMLVDKKRRDGKHRLVLPRSIGEVVWGYEATDIKLLTDL